MFENVIWLAIGAVHTADIFSCEGYSESPILIKRVLPYSSIHIGYQPQDTEALFLSDTISFLVTYSVSAAAAAAGLLCSSFSCRRQILWFFV